MIEESSSCFKTTGDFSGVAKGSNLAGSLEKAAVSTADLIHQPVHWGSLKGGAIRDPETLARHALSQICTTSPGSLFLNFSLLRTWAQSFKGLLLSPPDGGGGKGEKGET